MRERAEFIFDILRITSRGLFVINVADALEKGSRKHSTSLFLISRTLYGHTSLDSDTQIISIILRGERERTRGTDI